MEAFQNVSQDYMNLKYQPTTLFGQLRASWFPTCLHFPHFRLLGAFTSLLLLILLHLPFDLISFGGCILTSFGILLPRKDSNSSCLLSVAAGVSFWRGSTRVDKLEYKKSISCSEFLTIWIRSSNLLRDSEIYFRIATSIGSLGFHLVGYLPHQRIFPCKIE